MTNPHKTMETAIKIDYPTVHTERLTKRYAKLLVNRAVRFYIEEKLCSSVVDEDLADCQSDTEYYSIPQDKTSDLNNLKYAEKQEQIYQEKLLKML